MTIEYKNFELKKATLQEDAEYYYFKGYASTFGNVDNGGDVVVKGAFTDSLKKQMPKMVYQHNLQNPIGTYQSAKEDSEGLLVEGKLPKYVSTANDVGGLMKCGAIDSMSIGFTVDDYSLKGNVRYLNKVTLWEVSPVTIPMNPQAKITEIKSVTPFQDLPMADRDTKWDGSAATARVRKFTDSEDSPSESYKKAFMWYDNSNTDKFGSYKLPYADVIGGKLVAVPNAIIAIAGVLNGARGGTSISDAEQATIKNIVKKYYKKMNMPNPWESEKMGTDEFEYKNEDEEQKAKRMKADPEDDSDQDDDDDADEMAKRKRKKKMRARDEKEDEESDEDDEKPKSKKKKVSSESDDDDEEDEDSEDEKRKKNRKSLDIWDVKSLNKIQLESILRESGLFSKSASLYLASFFQVGRSESDVIENEQKTNSLEDEMSMLTKTLQKFKGLK